MAKQLINVGDGSVVGVGVVNQRAKDGSVRRSTGEFDLTPQTIARIQLDRTTTGRIFKKSRERILIMTSGGNRVELYQDKLGDAFDSACDRLRAFAKKNYVTLQDDLEPGATDE